MRPHKKNNPSSPHRGLSSLTASYLLRAYDQSVRCRGLPKVEKNPASSTSHPCPVPFFLLVALFILLYALHHLLLFQRKMQIWSNERDVVQHKVSPPALVTMSDAMFQYCALDLLNSARNLRWRYPIFLLTIGFEDFDLDVVRKLKQLGVFIIETNPIVDRWLSKPVKNRFVHRKLDIKKFRKMELFLNPIFRSFERLIYVDADGILSSRLDPFVNVQFPHNAVLLMRQNDRSVRKSTLWNNEMVDSALTTEQLSAFSKRYPDREKVGASCWFIVNVRMLQPPEVIFSKTIDILCNYRAAFKLNDQTLLNLLFYDNIFLFPWCVWDEVPVLEDSETLRDFCRKHMHLQRWINGDLAFVFRHMSASEKHRCVSARGVKGYNGGQGPSSRPATRSFQGNGLFASILDKNKSCLESLHEWKQIASSELELQLK